MAFNYRTEYQRYRQYYVNLRRFYQRPVVRVSVFVLLSFATVVFFSVFAIRPTVTTIGELVREIEDKSQIDETLTQKVKALDELQGQLISVQDEAALIFEVLPNESALGRLMQALEYLAKQEGVVVVSVQFQPVVVGGESSQGEKQAAGVDFSFSAGGAFANVRRFLDSLERLDRILVFSRVDFLSGATNLRAQGLATVAKVEGQAFFLKEAAEEGQ